MNVTFKCKKMKLTHITIALSAVIFMSACGKIDEFGNINQNPGSTNMPNPSALLTNVLASLGNDSWDAAVTSSQGLTTICGFYCQYFSETLYTELSTYSRPNLNWDAYYAGRLYDLQIIINYNSDPLTASDASVYGSNNNQIAIARILKVYLFSLLTDCYGDLPYFGALKADNGIVAYDAQEKVYEDFFKELGEAVTQFDNGRSPLGDIFFNGDLTMWRRFANSLHALLALQLSRIDESLGKTEFNNALTAPGGVLEGGVNAELKFPGVNYQNPVYNYHLYPPYRIAAAQSMTDWLLNHHDSRQNAYATSSLGFPYGLTRDSAVNFGNTNTDWAKILKGQNMTASDPFPIILDAEVYLARAEAAQIGWTKEDVSNMYEQGIEESWKYWGVYSDTDFEFYMAQPAVALTGTNNIQKICEQEWVAHYPNGLRGWDVWRRSGYPVLTPAIGSTSQQIPRRIPYGSNEYNTNAQNANAAAAKYTVNGELDSQYGRIWWDMQ